MPKGRRLARVICVQALYESDITNRPASQCIPWLASEYGLKGGNLKFARSLIAEVESGRDRLDAKLSRFANWSASEEASDVILMNVLRLAVAEMGASDAVSDASDAVCINEAVNVSKLLTNDGGGRFVNGVLGAISRSESARPKRR